MSFQNSPPGEYLESKFQIPAFARHRWTGGDERTLHSQDGVYDMQGF